MSILAIGDQHFKSENIKEIEQFLEIIITIATEQKPDIIVLLGDMLHTHEKIHTDPLNKAYHFINKMREIALTFILVGNHDYINASQFLTENHWLNGLKEWNNVVVVDKIVHHMFKDKLLVFSPYTDKGRLIEALDTNEENDWRSASLIFCHQEFRGCQMGGYLSTEGDEWDLSFPQIVSGHIHQKNHLQDNIYYTGSSMEVTYGESDSNCVAIINLEEDIKFEEIDLNLSRKRIIEVTLDEFENFVIPDTNDKLKIKVLGLPFENFKTLKKTAKYRELVSRGIKVDFKIKKAEIKMNNQKLQDLINESNMMDFRTIFDAMAKEEKDPYFHEFYEFIMNKRVVKAEDILII